jgi:hypothetical protein
VPADKTQLTDRICKAGVVPTIICPRCGTENRPSGLSGLVCEHCQQTIDPRQSGGSAETFVRRQRRLRKKSEIGPLDEDEAGELLEWVLDLPQDGPTIEGDGRARRLRDLLTAPWRSRAGSPRLTGREVLYADSIVRMREDGVVINRYYWPMGRKRIPYDEIRSFTTRPLRAWHGQFRVQGVDHRGRWYSRDRHRGEKERAIDLDVGGLIHPVLTPDDVDKVLEILELRLGNAPT